MKNFLVTVFKNKKVKIITTSILISLVALIIYPSNFIKAVPIWLGLIVLSIFIRNFSIYWINITIPYLFFYSTTLLTAVGAINVLTGLDGGVINSTGYFWGLSFFTLSMASILKLDSQISSRSLIFLIQPIRFFTGPITTNLKMGSLFNINKKRISVSFTWIILGIFFTYTLAPSFKLFLYLKESTHILDVVFFAISYEFYVYLNFAGISFIVIGFLRLLGVNCNNNFNAPFASKNIIEFWQRWHMSLGYVCKQLFFQPLRRRFNITVGIIVVFMSSALWHGVSVNFLMWGIFHSVAWLITYKLIKLNKQVVAGFLLFPILIFGRLLFSESNTAMLLAKIGSILTFDTSEKMLLMTHKFDGTSFYIFLISVILIFSERIFSNSFKSYKFYRSGWMPVLLAVFIVFFSVDDNVVIYGAR